MTVSDNYQPHIRDAQPIFVHCLDQRIEAGFTNLIVDMPRVNQHMWLLPSQNMAPKAGVTIIPHPLPDVAIKVLR